MSEPSEPSQSVKIVSGPPLTKKVPFIWGYEHEGQTYKAVTVRRMTVAEVEAFVEAAKAEGAKAELPMFDVPQAVIDALMPDDSAAVNEIVRDFLPRALRPATA